MRCFHLFYIVGLSFFLISCGKEKTTGVDRKKRASFVARKEHADHSRRARRNQKPKSEKLLDSDTFSKAFTTKVYVNEDAEKEKETKNQKIDWSRFFSEGELATPLFSVAEYASKKTPASSCAAAVTDGTRYAWLPHWRYVGRGSVSLPGAALSPDASLLAVLETVFPKSGPVSTLLVLINTYNWSVERIHNYPDKVFSNMSFRPKASNPEVVVWEGGAESGAPGHLRLISLKNGAVLSSSDNILSTSVRYSVAPSGDFLVLKTNAGTNALYLLSFANFAGQPKKITTKQKFGIPAVSSDSSLIAFAGDQAVEVFTSENRTSLDYVKHSLKALPDALAFLPGAGNRFALLAYSLPCDLLADGEIKMLAQRSGHCLLTLPRKRQLLFEEYKNSALAVFDLRNLAVESTFNPRRVKPKTRGEARLLGYLPHLKKFLELDSNGNLFLFYKPGRKWRKTLVFSAKK